MLLQKALIATLLFIPSFFATSTTISQTIVFEFVAYIPPQVFKPNIDNHLLERLEQRSINNNLMIEIIGVNFNQESHAIQNKTKEVNLYAKH